jgi:cytochrome c553
MKKIVIASIATLAVASVAMANPVASCVGCHGMNGEKNTIKKDMVPNKLTHDEMVTKLKAFRAGTEGTLMKNFSKKLSDEQIEAIAAKWAKK